MQHKNPQVFWRKHVQDWIQSGLIPAQYCIRHALNEKTFSRWKIKLYGPTPKPTKKLVGPAQSPSPFIAVSVVEDRESPEDLAKTGSVQQSGLRLKLPRNRCVEIDAGFDEDTLRRLLAVLEKI